MKVPFGKRGTYEAVVNEWLLMNCYQQRIDALEEGEAVTINFITLFFLEDIDVGE